MENFELFSQRLKYLMDHKKINNITLSEGISVGSARITGWLNGSVKNPQTKTLYKMIDYFGCDYDWLKDGIGEPYPEKRVQISPKLCEPTTVLIRNYREISELDDDILLEIQTWINDLESYQPGFTAWFRLEFQNRFPEFDDWKKKQFKKAE